MLIHDWNCESYCDVEEESSFQNDITTLTTLTTTTTTTSTPTSATNEIRNTRVNGVGVKFSKVFLIEKMMFYNIFFQIH